MPRLPRLRGRELIAALKRAGFGVLRIKGSHHFLQHSDGRRTVVPVHAGETLGPSPDISHTFCCGWLQARLAALASRSSPDSMFSYSPVRNGFGRLARRTFAAPRDESV
jgi:predicted RNA binding protein YcfA (HicA-like mRNA interferase family)